MDRSSPPDGANRTRAAALGGLAALGTGLFLFLFLVRFVLFADLTFVSPEECHTGAIASELLAHGFRFPLAAYTPVPYENGIVIEGILAVPLFALLGQNVLALKLLPHLVSVGLALAGVALQRHVLDELGVVDRRSRAVAAAAFVLALALSPAAFTFKSVEAVGDHLEATALAVLLLLLLARRIERPRTGRFVALWALAGLFAFWQKGALLAAGAAGVYELLSAYRRRGRAPLRRLVGAATIFATAYLPSLWVHEARGFQDARLIADKLDFGRLGAGRLDLDAALPWLVVDKNPALLAAAVWALAWYVVRAARARGSSPLLLCLAAYASMHALAMCVTSSDSYYLYGFPVLVIPMTAGVARLVERALKDPRLARRTVLVPALALLVVAAVMQPRVRPRPGRPAELLRDVDHAACFWRFGKAFLVTTGNIRTAADWCRRLGGDRAHECLSGMAMEGVGPAIDARSPAERRAVAFGTGRMRQHEHPGSASCADFAGDERVTCDAGDALECLVYADMVSAIARRPRMSRPACVPPFPPPGRYFRAFAEAEAAAPGAVASSAACGELAASCVLVP